MHKQQIERAAGILVQARRDMRPLTGLPEGLKPTTFEEAHAIQDAVSRQLGQLIGGFKAMAPAHGDPTRGILYGGTIHPSPHDLPAALVPQCGVEGEVAFVFRRDLPARAAPYTRNEVSAVVEACAAIEVVHSRYATDAPVSNLEKLADSISNGGFVHDAPRANWRDLQLGKLKVTLTVNGTVALEQVGGHPTGDPLGVAVVLANLWREKGGVRAGQFVTCGSCTGLKFLKPGDVCAVRFEGLGEARVTFSTGNKNAAATMGTENKSAAGNMGAESGEEKAVKTEVAAIMGAAGNMDANEEAGGKHKSDKKKNKSK